METQPDGSAERSPRRASLVGPALAFYAVLFGAAALWAWVSGRSLLFADPHAAVRGIRPLLDPGAGLLAAGIAVAASRALTVHSRWGDGLARVLGELLGRPGWSECLLLAALSGVAEEAFFRGALQPRVGLVAASLLFGLAHFVPRRELLPFPAFSALAGLALGGLFVATGNLVAPIVAHATLNAVNLHWLGRRYGRPREGGRPSTQV